MNNESQLVITEKLAKELIIEQFPEYAVLPISDVKHQGHDNRTYRLGNDMLIRLPTKSSYALSVEKEQKFLPQIGPHLTTKIPIPIKMGLPSSIFPFHFSIYKWLEGESTSHLCLNDNDLEYIAKDIGVFLKELQTIKLENGPIPGLHNYYRGAHISVYGEDAKNQILTLSKVLDSKKALKLLEQALATKWNKALVLIHGDLASGNILINNKRLSAVIDFGCMAIGDPACDLTIAWTLFKGKSRNIFIQELNLDKNAWLRAHIWCLWKSTFELCQINDKNSSKAMIYKKLIEEILEQ